MKEDNCEQLCNVGDKLYRLRKNGITEVIVEKIDHYPHCVYRVSGDGESFFNRAFGRTLFKTFEEANLMIQKRNNIGRKRELLKEYERKLNEELNIKDHYIIK